MSRQGVGQQGLSVSRQARIVRVRQSAQRMTEEFYHDKEFSVATGFTMFSIATEKSLSQ